MRKTTILISALFILLTQSFLFSETTIANWTFESQTNTATIGSGTITLIGSITSTYATGIAPNTAVVGGTTGTTSGTSALNTATYPAASVGAKTAGIQIAVSTSGYNNIQITADIRHSNTSANKVVLQYSTNGTDWVDATNYSTPAGGDNWYLRTYDFSSIAAVNNNSSFAVRYVTDFDGTASAYLAAKSSSTYATTGTIRFDNVTISGTAISTDILKTVITKKYSLSNNTLTFTELPTSKIEVYTLTGSKAAVYEPAQSVDLKLSKGVYVLKVDNQTSKIMLK